MPTNKNATARYLIIDSCLMKGSQQYPTKQDLQNKIDDELSKVTNSQYNGISESSVTKDIQAMKRLYKAPINYNRQNRVYEYTIKDYSIRKYPLNADEINALNYSILFLNKLKGTDLHGNIESAINKVINDFQINNLVEQSDKNILQAEEPLNNDGNKWMVILLYAITHKECLEILYKSYQRNETIHIFSPYILKEYRKRWYVIGYNHNINKVLSLGLDRIVNVEMSATNYFRDPDFSEDDYFNYCLGIMKSENDKHEKVVLEFNDFQKPYILSQPLHKSQKFIKQTEEKLIIELEVYITHELIQMILAYGEQVKVLEPESLKTKITGILKENLKQYEE